MTEYHGLTHPQNRIWHVERSHPGTSMWNNAGTLKIQGRIDLDKLDEATQLFIAANDTVRLRIALEGGIPRQYVAPYEPVYLERLDFTRVGEKGLFEWDTMQTQAPMPLIDSPLFYFALAQTAPDVCCLYIKLHHIISDGVTLVVLANKIAEAYDALLSGEVLSPESMRCGESYLTYCEEERAYLASQRFARDEAFWLEQFATLPEPTEMKPRTSGYFSTKAKRKACLLSDDLSQAVRAFCKEHHVSVFVFLLAGFSLYLNRVLGKEDLILGAPVSNRTQSSTRERLGMYVSTVPVRVHVDGQKTFLELAKEISREWFAVLKHQRYPYDLLVSRLRERGTSLEQLYDISLSYQIGALRKDTRSMSCSGRWHFSGHQANSFNVHWNDRENDGRYVLDYDYLTPLFSAKEVDFVHEHLCNLVADMVAHPHKRLCEANMLSDDEWNKVVNVFSGACEGATQRDATPSNLVSLWNSRMHAEPDAPAVVFCGKETSVRDMDASARALACALRARGVGRGQVVALALARSDAYFVAALAVLKAGAAFMPIDKALPEERVHGMLADAQVRCAVTGRGAYAGWEGTLPRSVIALDYDEALGEAVCGVGGGSASGAVGQLRGDSAGKAALDFTDPASPAAAGSADPADPADPAALPEPDPADAAYIIYTSGSTGTPKGVVIQHGSIAHFAQVMAALWGRTEQARMLSAGPLSFDITIMEAVIGLGRGRTLVVADARQADYPDELCRLIAAQHVDMMMVTPGRMEMILASPLGDRALGGMREIGLGADALPLALLKRMQALTAAHITNFYGPTEATIAATCCDVTERSDVNIGRPLPGAHVYVLDSHQQPVPIGVQGELYIGGEGVAKGYVARDDLTAERFVPSPFDSGARLYRTGDVGRWFPRGEIQLLGRIDHQVKIRGYRVELGEIENKLMQVEGVRLAVAVACEAADGRKYLVGYVVGDDLPPMGDVKARLAEWLPFYMVPAYLIELDEVPLTSNEKIDRARLPLPMDSQAEAVRPPKTETERALAKLWTDVLDVPRVGRDDHFFDRGGDSLAIVHMIARVAETFDVELDLEEVYRDPTLAATAALIDGAQAVYAKPIRHVPVRRFYPATSTQQRMLFASRQEPESVAYNVPALYVFSGALDENRLRRALEALLQRHAALRTSLVVRDGAVMQQVHAHVALPFTSVNCDDASLMKVVRANVRPFDTQRAPLVRLVSVRTPKRHGLLFDFHHAVCDQVGLRIVLDDFSVLYDGKVLPQLAVSYGDCAVWLAERATSQAMERQGAFWREELAGGLPLLNLPTRRARGGSRKGASCSFTIPADQLRAIRKFVHDERATLASALMMAFGLVLARQAGQAEVVVGMPVACRSQTVMQQVAGAFINTVPVRCRFGKGRTVRAGFEEVNRAHVRALAHQDYPYERMVADAGVHRERGRNPLFDAMLVVGKEGEALRLGDVTAQPRVACTNTAKLDVTLFANETDAGLVCRLEYDKTLFSAAFARRMMARFAYVVATLFERSYAPLDRAHILPSEEYQLVTRGFSATDAPRSRRSLESWLDELAVARPGDEAVVAAGGRLTFAELQRRATQVACSLAGRGARPGGFVAVLMRRTADLLPVLFGVLKAGAAYVPVDPTYPPARVRFMLADSGAQLVVCDEATLPLAQEIMGEAEDGARGNVAKGAAGREAASMNAGAEGAVFPSPCQVVSVATLYAESCSAEAAEALVEACDDDPAYVIYTSGSTGQPKGSVLTRRGVSNLKDALATCVGYEPSWTAVSVTTMSFDIFMADALLPVCFGCRTVLADEEELRQPHLLARLLEREQVTFLQTTPSRMQMMIGNGDFARAAKGLKTVVLAGEKPTLQLVRRCKRLMPQARLKNGYGPTEVTVYTSFQDLSLSNHISIGRPLANIHLYVLDDDRRPVPIGTPGEAYLSGDGVSSGYLGRADLNEQRFLPDPFRPGLTMYRSGDVCSFGDDGEVFIHGRVDNQVKIRGLRIEPEEIEAQLVACAGVREAAVVVRGEGERKQLVAFYAGEGHAADVRRLLAERLPASLVPARFVPLAALPMTANGKIDRTHLPDVDCLEEGGDSLRELPASTAEARRMSLTKDQKRFVRVAERVLGVKGIGLDDNVFDLGGDSLAVIAMQTQLARFNLTLRTQDFYDAATIGELTARLQRANGDEGAGVGADASVGADAGASEDDGGGEGARGSGGGRGEDAGGGEGCTHAVSGEGGNHAAASHTSLLSAEERTHLNEVVATPVLLPPPATSAVLVTGATGFLGAHVVAELARVGVPEIICLVRAADESAAQARLDEALAAYFPDAPPRARARCGSLEHVDELRLPAVGTVFHCAALTEHVGKRALYERVNVEGTRAVVRLVRHLGARLMHVSTTSVAGRGATAFDERSFDVGQDVTFNEYARSKFLAEGVVLHAFAQGLPGLVFRVGNLTGRLADGMFQRDVHRNAFAMRLVAFALLGCYPQASDDSAPVCEMTPVDVCARAIVALSRCVPEAAPAPVEGSASVGACAATQVQASALVPDNAPASMGRAPAEARIFHVQNAHALTAPVLSNLFEQAGYPVRAVSPQAFAEVALARAEQDFGRMFGILRDVVEAPASAAAMAATPVSSQVTSNFLARQGILWPVVDGAYFKRYLDRVMAGSGESAGGSPAGSSPADGNSAAGSNSTDDGNPKSMEAGGRA